MNLRTSKEIADSIRPKPKEPTVHAPEYTPPAKMPVPDTIPEITASIKDKLYWFLYFNRAKFKAGAEYVLGLALAIWERDPIKLIRVFIPKKANELKENVQMGAFFTSKKVKMTLVTIAANIIAVVLITLLGIDKDIALALVGAIFGQGLMYVGSQGYADAKTGGFTSSTPGSVDHPVQ